jgi:ribosomal protein L1
MNDEVFNMEIRKFLKQVGVTSQRVIEQAARDAIKAGTLKGGETLNAHVTLTIDGLNVSHKIDGSIKLG